MVSNNININTISSDPDVLSINKVYGKETEHILHAKKSGKVLVSSSAT